MTKIILTGATGFVGDTLLRYCISRSDVTSIVVITRRVLPFDLQNNSKVTAILHEDFSSFPQSLLNKLEGAAACLWALGLRGAPLGYKDKEYAEMVDVTFPTAAATFMARYLTPRDDQNGPFRFVLCSGIGAELDQTKTFWLMGETKLLKGRAEKQLHDIAKATPGFEVYTCRPFGILEDKPPLLKSLMFSMFSSVKAIELAAVMLELGLHGEAEWIWENAQIVEKGQKILHI